MKTVTRQCSPGHWCTAGREVGCTVGYYNPHFGADNQTACVPCPISSTTFGPNSTSSSDCVCVAGTYNAGNGSSIQCQPWCAADSDPRLRLPRARPCIRSRTLWHHARNATPPPSSPLSVLGTLCEEAGVTLSNLPIKPGYFRFSSTAVEVVRCSDSGFGCGVENECIASNSGCRGGSDPALSCHPGLEGIFCELCTEWSNRSARMYYVAATEKSVAECRCAASHAS